VKTSNLTKYIALYPTDVRTSEYRHHEKSSYEQFIATDANGNFLARILATLKWM
jgi:hypothetical protein